MRLFFFLFLGTFLLACGSKQTAFHKFDRNLQGADGSGPNEGDLNKSDDANSAADSEKAKKNASDGVDIEMVDSGLSDEEVDAMMDADAVEGEGSEGMDDANSQEDSVTGMGKGKSNEHKNAKDLAKKQGNRPDHTGKPKAYDGEYDAILWPPNHKMVLMKVVSLKGQDGLSACAIEGITSSEDVGKDSFDYNIIDSETFVLRAERAGTNKDGRTYSLSLSCLDQDQNAVTVERKAWVPHNMGQTK